MDAESLQNMGFETRMIHGGSAPDIATGARQVPIYQTSSYVFKDPDHAARLFNLQELGYIYSRLTNPTVNALQERLALLEKCVACACTSSGHAAQILAMLPLMGPGLNIIASKKLYGGTFTQFTQTIKKFGWQAKLVDCDNESDVKNAIDESTRAIFCESIANPGGVITDMEMLSKIAHDAMIPLIVDNTMATPYLCNPVDFGADIVVHSTTKFISGNGTAMGGAVCDSGNFDWKKSGKFPTLCEPNEAYHDTVFVESFGNLAYIFHCIAVGLRDLGACLSPQNAFYTLLGLETLSLRMERHCENALKVAEFLHQHPKVNKVSYAGLTHDPYYKNHQKYCPKGAGAVFTVSLKTGFDGAIEFIQALDLFSLLANIGDAKSLIIHPASTTHRQLSQADRDSAGAHDDVIRLSIGIESVDDIIADLEKGLSTI